MTQDNASSDDAKTPPAEPNPPAAPTPPRKRPKWVKLLAATAILLVLLVLFIPTIASMGFVRSIVVGKINQNLDGRLAIDDWSLGWFTGTKLYGVHLTGPSGEKIASIEKITTQLSLLSAIRGNYDLGKTDIDGCEFWIKLDEQGQSNLAKLPKKHTKKPQEQTEPLTLPNVSGDFTIHAKGEIQRPDATIGASRPQSFKLRCRACRMSSPSTRRLKQTWPARWSATAKFPSRRY